MSTDVYLRDQPTATLEVGRIGMVQRLELMGQRQRGVIIVAHMLVIFGQMLKGCYTLALRETVPDQHGSFPETTPFIQQGQIEQAGRIKSPLVRLQMGEGSDLVTLSPPVSRNRHYIGSALCRRDKCFSERWQ